jgi:hypothetical protein
MPDRRCSNTTENSSPSDGVYVPEDFVWGTNKKAKSRAFSLYIIRSIVEKYGGTVVIDIATNTIDIDVPEKERLACAQEIEENVGSLCS